MVITETTTDKCKYPKNFFTDNPSYERYTPSYVGHEWAEQRDELGLRRVVCRNCQMEFVK